MTKSPLFKKCFNDQYSFKAVTLSSLVVQNKILAEDDNS